MDPRKFDHRKPETWTWNALNEWLMSDKATVANLQAALDAEQGRKQRRLSYAIRLHSRLSRLQRAEAREALLKGG